MTVLDHLIRTPLITAELLLSLPTRWSPKDISCPRTPDNRGVRTDFVEARGQSGQIFIFILKHPGPPYPDENHLFKIRLSAVISSYILDIFLRKIGQIRKSGQLIFGKSRGPDYKWGTWTTCWYFGRKLALNTEGKWVRFLVVDFFVFLFELNKLVSYFVCFVCLLTWWVRSLPRMGWIGDGKNISCLWWSAAIYWSSSLKSPRITAHLLVIHPKPKKLAHFFSLLPGLS